MTTEFISDDDFRKLLVRRSRKLLIMANYCSQQCCLRMTLTRPFLGEFFSQSTQLEELLDAYGAHDSMKWSPYRSTIAAIKLFSDVSYELLHIRHSLPIYRLLPLEQDFLKSTEQALAFTSDILLRAIFRILKYAHQLELPISSSSGCQADYDEPLPAGQLSYDQPTRKVDTVAQTVTLLATAYLNLAAETKNMLPEGPILPQDYANGNAGMISEDNIRSLELRFHNLQALYDTHVSKTDIESRDTDLPVLRGHISIVFHLLKTATAFAHYYERHVDLHTTDAPLQRDPLVHPEELLEVLTGYSINFVTQYISCAQRLCRTMLSHYAETGNIEVAVPLYRGFHVRPATLISKLVMHYGSNVVMQLDGEKYDAGSPLELFRANERINAQKRKRLAEQIVSLGLIGWQTHGQDVETVVKNIIQTLAQRNELVVYTKPLQLQIKPSQNGTRLFEQVSDEIARLQATGVIDITTDLKVTFQGDKRVLADIKLLAESGYGEDTSGNNIELPKELPYLHR